MAGSKKISELDQISQIEITDQDIMVLVDQETNATKKVLIGQFDTRYTKNQDFNTKVSDRLLELNTDYLPEGDNLYYTQDRFDAALGAKTTDNLTEGSNQYYTEEKVSANADVAANTNDRHVAVTLGTTAVDAGITLDEQEVSMEKATSIANGYLDKDDHAAFSNKKDQGPQDDKGEYTGVTDSNSTPTAIGLQFNEVDGFAAEITFVCGIDSDTELLQYFKHVVIFNSGVWTISAKINALGDDSKITISISTDGLGHGLVRHISGLYTNFVSGFIKYRAETI